MVRCNKRLHKAERFKPSERKGGNLQQNKSFVVKGMVVKRSKKKRYIQFRFALSNQREQIEG